MRKSRAIHPTDKKPIQKINSVLRRAGGSNGYQLTEREHQVLVRRSEGKTLQAIADELYLSYSRVKQIQKRMLWKMIRKNLATP